MQVRMLYAVVGLDVVGPVPRADRERARNFGVVVKLKVRIPERTDLSNVVECVFDKGRYRPVVWRTIDMEIGNNPWVEKIDSVDVVVVLVTFGCSLGAGKEGEDDSIVRPCQLTH